MGLTAREVSEMTFAELSFYVQGVSQREREEWKRARLIAWAVFQSQAGKGKKIKPESILKLDDDRETKGAKRCQLSPEEYRKLADKFKRLKKKEDGD